MTNQPDGHGQSQTAIDTGQIDRLTVVAGDLTDQAVVRLAAIGLDGAELASCAIFLAPNGVFERLTAEVLERNQNTARANGAADFGAVDIGIIHPGVGVEGENAKNECNESVFHMNPLLAARSVRRKKSSRQLLCNNVRSKRRNLRARIRRLFEIGDELRNIRLKLRRIDLVLVHDIVNRSLPGRLTGS